MGINSVNSNPYRERLRFIDVVTLGYIFVAISGNTAWFHLYISLALFFVWLIVLCFSRKSFLNDIVNNKMCRLVLWFTLYSFVCGVIGGTVEFALKQMGLTLITFSPITMFLYYSTYESEIKQKTILRGILVIWIIYSIRSIGFFATHPGAARILASDSRYYGDVAIGGAYVLAYGSAIIAGIAVNLILDGRMSGRFDKVLWLSLLITSIILVIMTESAVTLVAMIIGVVFVILFRNKKDENLGNHFVVSSTAMLKGCAFVVIIVLVFLLRDVVGNQIVHYASSIDGILGIRLKSLGNTIAGVEGVGDSYALSRAMRNVMSLESFFQHPVFGVCYLHGNGYDYSVLTALIGNHCEWADALGNYGIVGGIPFLMIFVCQVRRVLFAPAKISKGWIVMLLLLGLFNPFKAIQPYLVVFFIVPVVAEVYHTKGSSGIEL